MEREILLYEDIEKLIGFFLYGNKMLDDYVNLIYVEVVVGGFIE